MSMMTTITIALLALSALALSFWLGRIWQKLEHEVELADFRCKLLIALHKKIDEKTEEGENNETEGN